MYGNLFTRNNSDCSQNVNYTTTPNDVHTTTPNDVVDAAVIASIATIASITAIASTEQKTAGVALATVAAAAKAIKGPTTINVAINNKGTAATEITQDQAYKIFRIQANLDKYATLIEGISSFTQNHGHQQ